MKALPTYIRHLLYHKPRTLQQVIDKLESLIRPEEAARRYHQQLDATRRRQHVKCRISRLPLAETIRSGRKSIVRENLWRIVQLDHVLCKEDLYYLTSLGHKVYEQEKMLFSPMWLVSLLKEIVERDGTDPGVYNQMQILHKALHKRGLR